MRAALWIATTLVAGAPWCGALAMEGDGLTPWPRWQGRLSLSTSAPGQNAERLPANSTGLAVRSFSLMGDYYFAGPVLTSASVGGFRATSGLIVGARASSALSGSSVSGRAISFDRRSVAWTSPLSGAELAPEAGAAPYLGVGYTGLSSKGGWGFSADIGIMAFNPGSTVKLGRVFGGGQSLDEVVRDMRLSPLVQMGVSYSF
jgi:hypothetical protein